MCSCARKLLEAGARAGMRARKRFTSSRVSQTQRPLQRVDLHSSPSPSPSLHHGRPCNQRTQQKLAPPPHHRSRRTRLSQQHLPPLHRVAGPAMLTITTSAVREHRVHRLLRIRWRSDARLDTIYHQQASRVWPTKKCRLGRGSRCGHWRRQWPWQDHR